MTGIPTNPEIVIVGAGAAGIGAGLALTRLGVPFVILEAKERVGGRAYSEDRSVGTLWDHGCHWFHSAEINPLRMIADRLGHPFRARTMLWAARYYLDGRRLNEAEAEAARGRIEDTFMRIDAHAGNGPDRAVAEVVDLSPPYGIFARWVLEATSSGPPENLSLIDNARYAGTEEDYGVIGGYGALLVRMARGLPVRLSTSVHAIRRERQGVRIETTAGSISARAAIVTVSTNVLRSGALGIEEALIEPVATALDDVICGDCEKIALEVLDGHGDPFDGYADAGIHCAHGGRAFGIQVRPYGRPLVTAYLAGGLARELGAAGDKAGGAFLTERLVEAFGSNVRKAAGRAKVTAWIGDRHVLGAYSYVKAGRARAREALVAAELAPLYLAGEAMLLDHYSTAHGAYLSGIGRAHQAAERLGYPAVAADPLWLPPSVV